MRMLMQIRDWFIRVLTWLWNLLFPKANRPPIAAFTATPATGAVPFEVVYDASASSDPDDTLSSYAWDFGDGQGGTGVRITHSYTTRGSYTVKLTVTDTQGASSSTSQTVIALHANQPPIASFTVAFTSGGDPLSITCDASTSSDPDGTLSSSTWDFGDGQSGTGVTVTHRYASAGRYVVTLTVTDNEGASSATSQTITISEVLLPPDPTTVAPALDQTVVTSLAASTEFLYTGDAPIQTGVAAGTILPNRAAVLRGRVINPDGTPLPAVQITVLQHPEFGSTMTRSDGMFDMVVNGGGLLTITYEKEGYLSAQRQVQTPWQDYRWLPDVVLLLLDSKKTTIDLTAAPLQVAQGSLVTDADGVRQATLLFPPGTQAELILPDGTTQSLQQITVRATEFTVGPTGPKAMPAPLPPTSGYTYAIEYSEDEALAAGATSVRFDRPLLHYVENFLDFPTGMAVPVGYYDKQKAAWIPSENGRVIKIVSITAGLADLDTDGDGTADNGIALGVTTDERQQLATLYQTNQSLWRVPITHFTQPWDCNFPYGPPLDARAPNLPAPRTDDRPDNPCETTGSKVNIQGQILGEEVAITGTPFLLQYQSDRVPGRTVACSLDIPLSGTSLPASLKWINLEIGIAGRQLSQSFPADPEQQYHFVWDGKDAYGRRMQGQQLATIRVGYVYQAVYQEPAQGERAFANLSGVLLTGNRARQEITPWQEWRLMLSAWDSRVQGLGGWSLNVHHVYDPMAQTLYLGTGKRRNSQNAIINAEITTVAGKGSGPFRYSGDGGPATAAELFNPRDIAVSPDGTLYFADSGNNRIRRIGSDGIITTVAGNGSQGYSGDGGPATAAELFGPFGIAVSPDGILYIADYNNHRIRRVGSDGIITTVAGNGIITIVPGLGGFSYSGDGGPATAAQLLGPSSVTVSPDSTLFFADSGNGRIRRVGPDGIITTVAGNGSLGYSGDGGPATAAQFNNLSGIAVGPDGALYMADSNSGRIRRVGPDGIITTVAGNGSWGYSGDGGPATAAELSIPYDIAVGPDGTLYIADTSSQRIRRVGPDGIITTVAGNGLNGYSGDGGPATAAELSFPSGIAVSPDGTLYIADMNNHRIRRIAPLFPSFSLGDYLIPDEDGSMIYRFNNRGQHLQTFDALTGNVLYQFSYDTAKRLLTITDRDENVTTIERNATGQPVAIVSPYGQRTILTLDANNYLAGITNPAGEAVLLDYTADGLLTSLTDPRGNVSHFHYDAMGRLTQDEDPAGGAKDLIRTEQDRSYTVKLLTALLEERTYAVEHVPNGDERHINACCGGLQTTSVKQPNGMTTISFPDGSVTTEVLGADPRWGMLAPLSKQREIKTPSGLQTTVTSARAVSLATPTNPLSLTDLTDTVTLNGRNYTSTYTAATRSLVSTTPTGRTVTTTLDAQGHPVQWQVAGLLPASYSYDTHGRLHTVTVGTGTGVRTVTLNYTATGDLESVIDPLGHITSFVYDAAGRVLSRTLTDGRVIGYAYDTNGNLTTLTPPGRPAHTFTYTPVNLVSSYTTPTVGTQNAQMQYTYDADRHLTHITHPDGLTVDLSYDSTGRLSSRTTPRGQTGYTYDATQGTMTTITAPGGLTLAYSYDGTLLLDESWTGAVTGTVSRTYDSTFRVTTRNVNVGNAITFQYDNDGLLTQVGTLTLNRNPQNGLLTGTTLGNITDTWSYNGFGELVSYHAEETNGALLYEVVYTLRDALGRILEKIETIGGISQTFGYSYDLVGQLKEVKKNGTTIAIYTYDSNGNRETYTDQNGTVVTGVYDDQDRLSMYGPITYSYTDNGDLLSQTADGQTTMYSYDTLGNLTIVTLKNGTTVTYLIDGRNRRIGKQVNGSQVQGFLYQDGLKPIAELNGTNNVVSRFVYASRSNVPDYIVKGGITYRIITDYVGSPRLVVDSATGTIAQQMDYDTFGNVTVDTNPGFQPFGFAGGLYDRDTKLILFGARDYDTEIGRWIAKDPIGFASGSTNLYIYISNDPVNFVDITGLAAPTGLTSSSSGSGSTVPGYNYSSGSGSTAPGYNWCGPGHRVDPSGNPLAPANNLDNACFVHDKMYEACGLSAANWPGPDWGPSCQDTSDDMLCEAAKEFLPSDFIDELVRETTISLFCDYLACGYGFVPF